MTIITALSIIHVLSLLIASLSVFLLFRAYKRTKNLMVKYFMMFFVFVVVWMTMYFVTLFFDTGSFSESRGWFFATSHGFFLMGLAYFARIFAMLVFPKYERMVFLVSMTMAVTTTILGLTLWGEIITDSSGSISFQNDPLLIRISAILTAMILVPIIGLFFNKARKSESELVTVRSYLISFGLFLLLWHGLSLVLIPFYGKLPWLVGEALNVLAFFTLLIGILYKSGSKEKKDLGVINNDLI